MANKFVYNNTSYDVLDAITITNREYIILIDSNKLNNIIFLESFELNGEKKYFLPPKDFRIANNPNCDLRRLQTNFLMTNIVEVLKATVNSGFLKDYDDIKNKFEEISNFIKTDINIAGILLDNKNLSIDQFFENSKYLENYLSKSFNYITSVDSEDYSDYLTRPIRTSDGLDYEWLYELNLVQLKELAGSKNKTSEELIYILDALDKRQKSDDGINYYNEMGRSLVLTKKEKKSAFIDILLIVLITSSFLLLLLIRIF